MVLHNPTLPVPTSAECPWKIGKILMTHDYARTKMRQTSTSPKVHERSRLVINRTENFANIVQLGGVATPPPPPEAGYKLYSVTHWLLAKPLGEPR